MLLLIIYPQRKFITRLTAAEFDKPVNVCLTGWLQPVLNKEQLCIASPVFKLLLCRCNEAGYASRLGNNEISLMNQIGLNSVTKNRALIYPNQPNLIKQRTAAAAGVVHRFTWNKEELGADADVYPGRLTPQKKTAPLLVFKLNFNCPPRCRWQPIVLDYSPNPNDRARRPAGFNIA
jgi:hypothetical protein